LIAKLLEAERLNAYYIQILIFAGINIILAVSLNLINGYTGQFSLGHAGFMAIGGYLSASLTVLLKWPDFFYFWPSSQSPLIFPLSLIIGGIGSALTGILVGLPALRLKGDYLAIATLGFGEIIRVILLNINATGGARGLPGIPSYTNFFWVYFWVIITIFVIINLINSSHGRAIISIREDEIASELMGINITYYKVLAFVLGAFFAGIAGGLFGHYLTILNPNKFTFILSIEVVVMVVLGGMGSTSGVILSAIILTILPEALRKLSSIPDLIGGGAPILKNILSVFSEPAMRMVIYALILIILMITRPQGLMGNKEFSLKFFKKNKIK
ncbi:MAG: branched-chain amino acid ABC transporter permease, partial [Armatimonadetes bacterium]|nr:branched-chain amino acid ABC transporter permease [Armatimonadota bacterium]